MDDSKKSRFTKTQITKNLMVISVSFLMIFCASEGWAILQSTMNKEKGVGVISISVQYACGFVSALLLPKYLIKRFGSKNIIIASMLSYIPYLASNFYPSFALMMPTSLLLGIGSSLIWGSVNTYLSDIATIYAELCDSVDALIYETDTSATEIVKFKSIDISNLKGNVLKSCNSTSVLKPNRLLVTQVQAGATYTNVNVDHTFQETSNEIKSNMNLSNDSQTTPSSIQDFKELNKDPDEATFHVHSAREIDYNSSASEGAAKSLRTLQVTTAGFFGLFGCVYQSCHVWSNVISYVVIESRSKEFDYGRNSSCVCGAQFCNVQSECFERNLQMPSDQTRYILTIVYAGMSLLAVLLVALCLDDLGTQQKNVKFSLDMALATLRLHKKRDQFLLIPFSLYLGMNQAFLVGDYTRDFIGCAWGVSHVTLVIICAGVTISISSYLSGKLEKYLGRLIIFVFTAILNLTVIIIILIWIPDPQKPAMMFVVVGMWGVIAGSFWCQLRAFIGILFKEDQEAAFGSYQLWHALGCAVSFAYSNYVCSYVKIYLLLIVSSIGVVCYIIVERTYSKTISKKIKKITS